ncbi:MAG: HAMP domain-containing protein, partial [Hyphomicrobiaceae bacterium]|nr:HAMP domain-containing protein [Hyphomicrobiaceae bacterium]
MKLGNIKILYKVMILLAAMGGVAVFAALFSTSRMATMEATYSKLADNDYPALVHLARANRHLTLSVANLFRSIAYTDDRLTREAIDRSKVAMAEFKKRLTEMQTLDPTNVASYHDILADYAKLEPEFERAMQFSLENKKKEATDIATAFDPQVIALNKKVSDSTERSIEDNKKDSATASEQADSAVAITYASVFGGLLVISAAAFWLTVAAISRPLQNLAGLMEKLAKGDLTVDITGQDRRDEVGLMSRAVGVFKENAEAVKRMEAEAEAAKLKSEADRKQSMLDLAN